jgi:lipopolysaccharide biosynthesis glycosyltransferase
MTTAETQGRASTTPIRVLFCCDPGYFQHVAAALASLVENNDRRDLDIHVVTSRRDPALEQKLAATIGGARNAQLQFHGFEWSPDARWPTSHHVTRDAYLRLFAADILPLSIDRILYLDADLLVISDLSPLWELDIGDHALAAAPDPFEDGAALGLPTGARYVNSGVMLLNLARWRATAALERMSDYVRREGDRLAYHDQDALNAVLAGEIMTIDYRWNLPARLWRLPRGETPRDQEQVRGAMLRPAVIHFTTARKPWLFVMQTPHKSLYWRYLQGTPWRDAKPAGRRWSNLFERGANYVFYLLRVNYTWDRVLRRTLFGRALVRLQAWIRGRARL